MTNRLIFGSLIAASGLLMARPALAASFTFESAVAGYYSPSLVVVDGAQTLTITTEGFPDGFVVVDASLATGMGSLSVIGSQVQPLAVDRFAPMRFSFALPIADITFRFGDFGGDLDSPVQIQAFDSGNNLLGTLLGAYPIGQTVSATLSGSFLGASYFIVQSTPGSNDHSLYWEIDSYTLADSSVPEPATILLVGTGAALAVRRRRSRAG